MVKALMALLFIAQLPGGEAQIVGDQSQITGTWLGIPDASLGTVPVTTKQTCIDSLELPHEFLLHTSSKVLRWKILFYNCSLSVPQVRPP
jgi:hypothetical protein